MPHHTKFTARFRTVLLATTGLVAAGCTSMSNQSAMSGNDSQYKSSTSASSDHRDPEGTLSWESLMRVADHTWENGDPGTAMGLYATAAKDQPKNPEPLLKVAHILRKTGRSQDAISVYKKVLGIAPGNGEARRGIGYSQLQLGKPILATETFAAALTVNPGDAAMLGGLAVAYDKAGNHAQAQEYYRQAISADPDNLNYKSNLALSMALTGDTDEAIAILKMVTSDPKATSKHRQTLALAYGLAGQSVEAMKYSRMDLSEADARNNGQYFQVLNSKRNDHAEAIIEQASVMKASADTIDVAEHSTNDEPRQPVNPDIIVARHEQEYLSTNASKKSPAATKPLEHFTPRVKPPVMMAKSETPKPPVSAPKSVVATVMPDVEKSPAPTIAKAAPEKPVVVASVDPAAKPAPAISEFREWKAESKAAPITVASTPVVADTQKTPTANSNKPISTEVAFATNNLPASSDVTAYAADGGHYFLQIGSYKEKTQAEKGWKLLQTRNVDILKGIDPLISEVDLGSDKGGTFYRLQIGGFSDKTQTMALCGTLRDRNYDCFMAIPAKAGSTSKTPAADKVGPGQTMVENTEDKPTQTEALGTKNKNDSSLIADYKEGFDAL